MLRGQLRSVHPVRQEDVGPEGPGDGKAPGVLLADAALDPGVRTGKHDLHGVLFHPRLGQEVRRGTPVHAAVPTPSSLHGWLSGRGRNRDLPLPAHSRVTGMLMLGARGGL